MTDQQASGVGSIERETNRAFAVEQNGINLVTDAERNGSARDLVWIWAGANVILTYIIVGSVLVVLGLTMAQMLAVVLLGNLFFVFVGMGGVPGARVGTATMVISRAAFGRHGNIIPAVLSWLTVIGWEAVNIVLGAFGLFSLFDLLGYPLGIPGQVIVLGVLVVATFGVAILGHATISALQRVLTWVLGILMLGLLPQVIVAPVATRLAGADFATLCVAFTIVAAMPVSYANTPAEYARYLPRKTSARAITFWTAIGAYVPAVVITVIGYLAARSVDMTDPIGGFQPLLAPWYFGLFVLAVVGGSMANNFINTYSSGMSLLAMDLKVSRPVAIMIDAVLATAAAAYAIFYNDFTTAFIAFLSLTVVWIAPWWAIYLIDAAQRGERYRGADMLSAQGGAYAGWNSMTYVAWLAGMAASLACTSAEVFTSGFAVAYLGGADLSIPAGMLVAGLLYVLLPNAERRA